MTRRCSLLVALALVGCGESAASTSIAPPTPPVETPPEAPVEAPTPPVAAPTAPIEAPHAEVLGGDVYELFATRYADEAPLTLLVKEDDVTRPAGPVIGYAEVHHAHWEFREIEALASPPAPTAVVVSRRGSEITLCESPVSHARRLHAELVSDDEGQEDEGTERSQATFLALEVTGCERGDMAIVGVPIADVSAHDLSRTSLSEHAPLTLVDLVKERDPIYGEEVAAADFRMLSLPAYNITFVVGENAWMVRDGRVLEDPGGNPAYVVQAGPRAFFWIDSPSDSWSSSLDCAAPAYDPGSCEIIDESGTPTNVRTAPSGRSAVVTTVTRGTTIAADDHIGSWYRLLTTPPGWAHESGLRCTPLPRHPSPPCR